MNADWIVPAWPAPPGVRAVCTTRAGGVSKVPFDLLNLGEHVGDDPAAVRANRAVLAHGIKAHPVFLEQVHGTTVVQIDAEGADQKAADGAWTASARLACTAMVADCLPVLLCTRAGDGVAALHAGWRGLAGSEGSGIVEAGVSAFRAAGLTDAAHSNLDLMAWLGPCIGPEAFEVGDEVRDTFMQFMPQASECFTPGKAGKWLANLPALARARLHAAGVRSVYGNDGSQGWCTVTNSLRFFSHRRDRVSGRMAACIWRV